MLVKEADAGRTIALVLWNEIGTNEYRISKNQEGFAQTGDPNGTRVYSAHSQNFIRLYSESECVYVDQGSK
jgi:hypothetical protein